MEKKNKVSNLELFGVTGLLFFYMAIFGGAWLFSMILALVTYFVIYSIYRGITDKKRVKDEVS